MLTHKNAMIKLLVAATLLTGALIAAGTSLSLKIRGQLLSQATSLTELRTTLTRQEDHISTLKTAIDGLQQNFAGLEATRHTTDAAVSALGATLENTRKDLKDILYQQKKSDDAAKSWQVDYVKTLMTLEASLNTAQADLQTLESNTSSLKEDLGEDINKLRQHVSQTHQTLDAITRSLSAKEAAQVARTLNPALFNDH